MRCRFKHKIFQNEENGYTIAIFTTQDTSVPLSARDKYLASRNIIGFSAMDSVFRLQTRLSLRWKADGRAESMELSIRWKISWRLYHGQRRVS